MLQVLARELGDRRVLAEDRPAHRLVGISGRLKVIEDDVVGRVARLSDFLQHNLTFALELVLFERRSREDVGKNVERERHVVLQNARVKRRLLSARVCIEIAADRFDLFGDRARVASLSAFEGHVFEHVRDAHDVAIFVASAGRDPDSERRAFELRHRIGDYR